MIDPNKRIIIELTREQKAKLYPLFDEVMMATQENKPIMLLAQIYEVDASAVAVCNVIPYEDGINIQKLLSPDTVGETNGYDYAFEALQIARDNN